MKDDIPPIKAGETRVILINVRLFMELSKDEAIQVMECHKVRHSLGSTLLNQTSQS